MSFSTQNDRAWSIHYQLLIVDTGIYLDFPCFRVVWKRFDRFFNLDMISAFLHSSTCYIKFRSTNCFVVTVAMLADFDFANDGSCNYPSTA